MVAVGPFVFYPSLPFYKNLRDLHFSWFYQKKLKQLRFDSNRYYIIKRFPCSKLYLLMMLFSLPLYTLMWSINSVAMQKMMNFCPNASNRWYPKKALCIFLPVTFSWFLLWHFNPLAVLIQPGYSRKMVIMNFFSEVSL